MHTQPEQSFKDVQQQFTAYLRDPDHQAKPDEIEQRRMVVYRDLFYNNIEGFVTSCFPVLKSLLSDEQWHAMVRDFMIKHRCKSPLFNEIAHEFLYYLENERQNPNDPAFMHALCHYEWVELALSISDAEVTPIDFDPEQNYLEQALVSSPLAWPLAYAFPVHQIAPSFQPEEPSDNPVYLLVYRNQDDQVQFIELNPVSARLIDLLNNGQTGLEAAQAIAEELQHPNPDVVINGAKALIDEWIQKGILISPTT